MRLQLPLQFGAGDAGFHIHQARYRILCQDAAQTTQIQRHDRLVGAARACDAVFPTAGTTAMPSSAQSDEQCLHIGLIARINHPVRREGGIAAAPQQQIGKMRPPLTRARSPSSSLRPEAPSSAISFSRAAWSRRDAGKALRPGARAGVASSAGMAKALISQRQKGSLTGKYFRRLRVSVHEDAV